ncbi:MAG: AMP-binding protein, partial [Anaerolineae bacterium]|nr:AMP-binding protein [Anaerolineae bacterium]
ATIDPIPLGRGIDGVQLLVVSNESQLCGLGELGELWVRSSYLSNGYLDDEQLTNQRYIQNPFLDGAGQRVYKTGDTGRFRPDGSVEIVGRQDRQIKIRGQRFELGDVEAELEGIPGVCRAVVVPDEGTSNQEKSLKAYIQVDSRFDLTTRTVLQTIRKKLPNFMVPSRALLLDRLPLTANGKVDVVQLSAIEIASESAEPIEGTLTNPVEDVLLQIWGDVLGIGSIQLRDNFFEMGGNSLLALRVMHQIAALLKVSLPLRVIFDNPTIFALSREVICALQNGVPATRIVAANHNGPIPASYGQQRLWVLDRLDPGNPAYNISGGVLVEGPLDLDALQRSVQFIAERHAALRTHMLDTNG